MNQKEDVRAMMTNYEACEIRSISEPVMVMMIAVTPEPSLLFGSLGYILIFKEGLA